MEQWQQDQGGKINCREQMIQINHKNTKKKEEEEYFFSLQVLFLLLLFCLLMASFIVCQAIASQFILQLLFHTQFSLTLETSSRPNHHFV